MQGSCRSDVEAVVWHCPLHGDRESFARLSQCSRALGLIGVGEQQTVRAGHLSRLHSLIDAAVAADLIEFCQSFCTEGNLMHQQIDVLEEGCKTILKARISGEADTVAARLVGKR